MGLIYALIYEPKVINYNNFAVEKCRTKEYINVDLSNKFVITTYHKIRDIHVSFKGKTTVQWRLIYTLS